MLKRIGRASRHSLSVPAAGPATTSAGHERAHQSTHRLTDPGRRCHTVRATTWGAGGCQSCAAVAFDRLPLSRVASMPLSGRLRVTPLLVYLFTPPKESGKSWAGRNCDAPDHTSPKRKP